MNPDTTDTATAKTRPHRTFTDEFKRDAVARIGVDGKTAQEVARELKIHAGPLRNWQKALNGKAPKKKKNSKGTALVHVKKKKAVDHTARYSEEFKAAALRRLDEPRMNPVKLAGKIGVNSSTLYAWMKRAPTTVAVPVDPIALSEPMVPTRLLTEANDKIREVLDRHDVTDNALVALATLILHERRGRV